MRKEELKVDDKLIGEPLPVFESEVPFPEALKSTRMIEKDSDIYETFRQCEKLPPKCSDPGMFTIPCTIGELEFERAMLDLGASINVNPFSVYEQLTLGPLKDTSVVIQLADRSSVYHKGVVENVMVRVGKLVFPADFYVLDMRSEMDAIPVLLGRPFLKTAGRKIDVPNGSLTMEFGRTIVKFEINSHSSHSPMAHSLCAIDTVANHVLSSCRERVLPSKVSKSLQDSSPMKRKCVVLWDRREDAEASQDKLKAWFGTRIPRNCSSIGVHVFHVKSRPGSRSRSCSLVIN
ncbi:hypothetical protein vseg_019627 [Gypsophila vaccaria]